MVNMTNIVSKNTIFFPPPFAFLYLQKGKLGRVRNGQVLRVPRKFLHTTSTVVTMITTNQRAVFQVHVRARLMDLSVRPSQYTPTPLLHMML